jgi:hypothetical protein
MVPSAAFWCSPQAQYAFGTCDGSAADFMVKLMACADRVETDPPGRARSGRADLDLAAAR